MDNVTQQKKTLLIWTISLVVIVTLLAILGLVFALSSREKKSSTTAKSDDESTPMKDTLSAANSLLSNQQKTSKTQSTQKVPLMKENDNSCPIKMDNTYYNKVMFDYDGLYGKYNFAKNQFIDKDHGSRLGRFDTLIECSDACINYGPGCDAFVYADFGDKLNDKKPWERGCYRFEKVKYLNGNKKTPGWVTSIRKGAPVN